MLSRDRFALALLLLCAVAWTSPVAGQQAPSGKAPSYVTKAVCAECHGSQVRAWTGSHHDLAMQEASAATVLGDFDDAVISHFGVTSRFFRRDGGFYVRTDGPDGVLRDYRIDYTFGVTPLQQYLVAFPDGRYQALGLAWDTRPAAEGGQRWFHLYPNEAIPHGDELHWTVRLQNWNGQCAECHSTGLRKGYDPQADSFATTWSEIDVSCEACHGPGSAHVAWARAATGKDGGGDKGLVVDLRGGGEAGGWRRRPGEATAAWKGSPRDRAELAVCAPCHARRRGIVADPGPGRPFLDTHMPRLLDAGLYHADGQILDEVFVYGSFVQSRMHRAGVTCSDCHDPHGLEPRLEGNALCGQCHDPSIFDAAGHHHHAPGEAGARCVDCHMPATTYMVVDPRRDHSFRVPRPDLSDALDAPDACTRCHAGRSSCWAAEAVAQWRGPERRPPPHFGAALKAGRDGLPDAGDLLTALASDPAQPAIARATALSLLPRYLSPAAFEAYVAGLSDADPVVRAAVLRALEPFPPDQRLAAAGPLLGDPVRAVRIEAARVLAPLPAMSLSAEQGLALERAVAELVAAETASAERPESHLNLGNFYAARGRAAKAEAAYRTALRSDAGFVPAYVNLADLYRAQGRDGEGEEVLRAGLTARPDAAALHHALGLVLVRGKRLAEAVESLGRAAALEPDDPRLGYVYAVALNAAGDGAQAVAVLEQAHLRHPYHRDLLIALVTINRDRGALDQARKYARKLSAAHPRDETARRLLMELQRP